MIKLISVKKNTSFSLTQLQMKQANRFELTEQMERWLIQPPKSLKIAEKKETTCFNTAMLVI